jgi:hypothetical protein
MAMDSFFYYNGQKFKTKDHVRCNINGSFITDAVLYVLDDIESKTSDGTTAYICQNKQNGNRSPRQFGYKYSWAFAVNGDYIYDQVRGLEKVTTDCFKGILDKSFPRIGE